jgi:hypothetical protein
MKQVMYSKIQVGGRFYLKAGSIPGFTGTVDQNQMVACTVNKDRSAIVSMSNDLFTPLSNELVFVQ